MAEHMTEDNNGHPRTTVTLEPGETVWICRCFHSKKFPFCDSTHRQQQGHGPAKVTAKASADS